MPLQIPAETREVLETAEAARQPLIEWELAHQLSSILRTDTLSADERKGACAEWAAFQFDPTYDENANPWNTHFGPSMAAEANGQPIYIPDLAHVDTETLEYWETRATITTHPIMRARYADLVWDLKAKAIQQKPDVQFARKAVDAYLDAVSASLYKDPVQAAQSVQRALDLAFSINDAQRAQMCKEAIIARLDAVTQPREIGNWVPIIDNVLRSRKADLTPAEAARLVAGLERLLLASTTVDSDQFDPWAGEAVAQCLSAHYERNQQTDDVHRVIRTSGTAFEYLASSASPTLAMDWLQPVHDEYRKRGMTADAERVLRAYTEKGKHAAGDLKKIQVPVDISQGEFEQFLNQISEGTPHQCLNRIAIHFIPRAHEIRALLSNMLKRTPLLARIEVTRIVGDHYGATAGSIETDPDGRFIMQLAQRIDGESLFLTPALLRIRKQHPIDVTTILQFLEESPIFDPERRTLVEEGLGGIPGR